MFIYKLSGCVFESSCSRLNFRFRACFEQGVPWHSGNYRVWIHSKTRAWHDKNIQSVILIYYACFFITRKKVVTFSNYLLEKFKVSKKDTSSFIYILRGKKTVLRYLLYLKNIRKVFSCAYFLLFLISKYLKIYFFRLTFPDSLTPLIKWFCFYSNNFLCIFSFLYLHLVFLFLLLA